MLNQGGPFSTSIITICPTEKCRDCTGSISNELLYHKYICMCPCHFLNSDKTVRETIVQSDDQ